MDVVRTTVIVKTDIVGFTPMVGRLTESELQTLLHQQKSLISEIVAQNGGGIVKGEGDSFYIVFPSVTTAALAAIQMHERLRIQQVGRGEEKNLAIRVVIAVGDVLHKDNDLFGNTMNLVARIEKITPSDEIYLTYAAWMLLNKAEVQTEFVGEFSLEGVSEPEKIFKVEQRSKTKILTGQFIIVLDIRGWVAYERAHTLAAAENILIQLDDLVNKICIDYKGVVRNAMGDAYLLSFGRVGDVLSAAETLCQAWGDINEAQGVGLAIGIHTGDFNILRSYIFGGAINETSQLVELGKFFWPNKDASYVIVSHEVREIAQESGRPQVLLPLEAAKITFDPLRSYAVEHGVYQLVVGSEHRRASP